MPLAYRRCRRTRPASSRVPESFTVRPWSKMRRMPMYCTCSGWCCSSGCGTGSAGNARAGGRENGLEATPDPAQPGPGLAKLHALAANRVQVDLQGEFVAWQGSLTLAAIHDLPRVSVILRHTTTNATSHKPSPRCWANLPEHRVDRDGRWLYRRDPRAHSVQPGRRDDSLSGPDAGNRGAPTKP